MADAMRFRDRFVKFLSTQSDERDELLSRLGDDERKAFVYQCYHIPVGETPNYLSCRRAGVPQRGRDGTMTKRKRASGRA